jgi:hypothetical protein
LFSGPTRHKDDPKFLESLFSWLCSLDDYTAAEESRACTSEMQRLLTPPFTPELDGEEVILSISRAEGV